MLSFHLLLGFKNGSSPCCFHIIILYLHLLYHFQLYTLATVNHLRLENHRNKFQSSLLAAQNGQYASIIKANLLILFRDITAVCT